MARIVGVDLPREKHIWVGLTYIYGIGRTTSYKILEKGQVVPETKVQDLTEDEVNRIREVITCRPHCGRRPPPRSAAKHRTAH